MLTFPAGDPYRAAVRDAARTIWIAFSGVTPRMLHHISGRRHPARACCPPARRRRYGQRRPASRHFTAQRIAPIRHTRSLHGIGNQHRTIPSQQQHNHAWLQDERDARRQSAPATRGSVSPAPTMPSSRWCNPCHAVVAVHQPSCAYANAARVCAYVAALYGPNMTRIPFAWGDGSP